MEGIKRSIGTEPDQAPAFDILEYKDSLRLVPSTSMGLRDRALLLVGFAGAFRRSELVALNMEGIQFTRDGAVLTYQGSKTNQYGKTEQKALFFSPDPDTCPVRALQDYISLLGRQTGPLFVRIRKGEQVTDVPAIRQAGGQSDQSVPRRRIFSAFAQSLVRHHRQTEWC